MDTMAATRFSDIDEIDAIDPYVEGARDGGPLRLRSLLFAEAEHKLKTSLAVLVGWARTVDDAWDVMAQHDRRRVVSTVRQRADILARDTERVIEDFRAEAMGPFQPSSGPDASTTESELVELGSELEAAAATHRILSERHCIEVQPSGAVLAWVDRHVLGQILGHLIDNAVKYSPNGGTVVLRARRSGAMAEVVVSDPGMGIAQDLDLFAPFARGDNAGIPGTGLGLHIVRRLAESSGGTVAGRRNRARGSTFVVRLPGGPDTAAFEPATLSEPMADVLSGAEWLAPR
ncbi:MAG: sensor histidine kinase [Acidimicrobiales bacterium]